MKFTVEVEDFYLDEDSHNLEEELKKYVTNEVYRQIYKRVEDKIEKEIISKIDLMVKDQLYKKSLLFIDDFLKIGVIRTEIYEDGKTVKKDVTIEEYIKSKFLKDSGWGSPHESIKKIAENFGSDLKKRYDLQFAAHVVNSLALNGLLKDENVQKLLEKNS